MKKNSAKNDAKNGQKNKVAMQKAIVEELENAFKSKERELVTCREQIKRQEKQIQSLQEMLAKCQLRNDELLADVAALTRILRQVLTP